MRRVVITTLIVLGGLLWIQTARLRAVRSDNGRLLRNQTALLSDMIRYRTEAGQQAVSVQILEMKCAEFKRLRAADARRIRELGIKLRQVEATARTATATAVEIQVPLRDTVIACPNAPCLNRSDTLRYYTYTAHLNALRPILHDTLKTFRWNDPWVEVEGVIHGDSVGCRIESVDTLLQVVHRVPRRFLFIRWGTKAIRQEIVSSNPHTRIVCTEYVELKRRNR